MNGTKYSQLQACHLCSSNKAVSLCVTPVPLPLVALVQVQGGGIIDCVPQLHHSSSCHYYHRLDSISQKGLCTSCFSRGQSDLAAWLNSSVWLWSFGRWTFMCVQLAAGSWVPLRGGSCGWMRRVWMRREWEERRHRERRAPGVCENQSPGSLSVGSTLAF